MKNGNTKKKLNGNSLLLIVIIVLSFVMHIVDVLMFGGHEFARVQNFLSLSISNIGLVVAVTGMTIVMITGGIDTSVGFIMAMVCVMLVWMMEKGRISAAPVVIIVLLIGCVFGPVQDFLVVYLRVWPFIVTLAGVSFVRNMTSIISQRTISINSKTFKSMVAFKMYLLFSSYLNKKGIMIYPYIYPSVTIALVMPVLIFIPLKYTKFGCSIYVIGGNERSTLLLDLNVRKMKLQIHVLDSFLAELGGLLLCMSTYSGSVGQTKGFGIDTTAPPVIGGAPLTDGVGSMIGSLFGVLIKGTIKSLITFQGTLSFWWTRITIAALLCFFIILRSLIAAFKRRDRQNYAAADHVQRITDTSRNSGTASKGV